MAYSGWALPSILLCGARTFLSPLPLAGKRAATVWLASDVNVTALIHDPPCNLLAGAQGNDGGVAERVGMGHDPWFALQPDGVRIARKTVEIGAVKAREPLKAVERTGAERIAVVGGVAANSELRASLPDAVAPPLELCTDNAAMIASAARYAEAVPCPRYLALDAYAQSL